MLLGHDVRAGIEALTKTQGKHDLKMDGDIIREGAEGIERGESKSESESESERERERQRERERERQRQRQRQIQRQRKTGIYKKDGEAICTREPGYSTA